MQYPVEHNAELQNTYALESNQAITIVRFWGESFPHCAISGPSGLSMRYRHDDDDDNNNKNNNRTDNFWIFRT
jgi:hypothetical protein